MRSSRRSAARREPRRDNAPFKPDIGDFVRSLQLLRHHCESQSAYPYLLAGAAVTSDLSYFLLRASQERTAALQVRDSRARVAHQLMAEQYETRVRHMTSRHERLFFPLEEIE